MKKDIVSVDNDRIRQISRLRREGKTDNEIVDYVRNELCYDGYDMDALRSDMRKALVEWQKIKDRVANIVQMDEFYKSQDIIDECWRQYEKSKEPLVERETILKKTKEGEQVEKVTVKQKDRDGDIRYLQMITEQYDKQSQLMRLDNKIDTGTAPINLDEVKISNVKKLINELRPQDIEEEKNEKITDYSEEEIEIINDIVSDDVDTKVSEIIKNNRIL